MLWYLRGEARGWATRGAGAVHRGARGRWWLCVVRARRRRQREGDGGLYRRMRAEVAMRWPDDESSERRTPSGHFRRPATRGSAGALVALLHEFGRESIRNEPGKGDKGRHRGHLCLTTARPTRALRHLHVGWTFGPLFPLWELVGGAHAPQIIPSKSPHRVNSASDGNWYKKEISSRVARLVIILSPQANSLFVTDCLL